MCDSEQDSTKSLFSACSPNSCEDASQLRPGPGEGLTPKAAPFDLVLQEQRFANMMDILPELLGLFRANAGLNLDAIRNALSDNTPLEAAAAAHTLKGMASVVCATPVQELSARLEDALKNDDSDGAQSLFPDLEEAVTMAIAALNGTLTP
jgi:HPt (histidine-containing phosphotransfer) domain-containing protein